MNNRPEVLTVITSCTMKSDIPFCIKHIQRSTPHVKYIAYVDSASANLYEEAGWTVRPIPKLANCERPSPRIASRVPKLQTYLLGIETKFALWIDASIVFSAEFISEIVNLANPNSCISLFRHYKRSSVFAEALYCFMFGKLTFYQLIKAIHLNLGAYNTTLFMGGILLWNQTHPYISIFQHKLFFQMLRVGRDQLVLSPLIVSAKISHTILPYSLFQLITIRPHVNYCPHPSDALSRCITWFANFLFRLLKL